MQLEKYFEESHLPRKDYPNLKVDAWKNLSRTQHTFSKSNFWTN
jgi:hypothetical protein